MPLQNSIYIPLKISYDADGLVCIRNPSDGPLNHHLAECEHMISWVRSIYKVFKYTSLICKIWGFTERWITCSENKIHINSKTLFFFCVLVFRNFPWKIFSTFLTCYIKAVPKMEVFKQTPVLQTHEQSKLLSSLSAFQKLVHYSYELYQLNQELVLVTTS